MIKNKRHIVRPEIDLSGPEGNAYYLLGLAQKYSIALELDAHKILEEMRSGDYANLIKVFDSYFGEYVDLILPEESYD